jgi:hypothetical protein
MSCNIDILQGTDVPMRTFKTYDEDGTVVLVADMNDYAVFIYTVSDAGAKTLHYTFKKTPGVGEYSMVTVDTSTLGFVVTRTMTAAFSAGTTIYAEIEVQLSASNYPSSLQNSAKDGFVVANIIESASASGI